MRGRAVDSTQKTSRRREAVQPRAKTHLRRKSPMVIRRLAVNQGVGQGQDDRWRGEIKIGGFSQAKIRPEQGRTWENGANRVERIAETIVVATGRV